MKSLFISTAIAFTLIGGSTLAQSSGGSGGVGAGSSVGSTSINGSGSVNSGVRNSAANATVSTGVNLNRPSVPGMVNHSGGNAANPTPDNNMRTQPQTGYQSTGSTNMQAPVGNAGIQSQGSISTVKPGMTRTVGGRIVEQTGATVVTTPGTAINELGGVSQGVVTGGATTNGAVTVGR